MMRSSYLLQFIVVASIVVATLSHAQTCQCSFSSRTSCASIQPDGQAGQCITEEFDCDPCGCDVEGLFECDIVSVDTYAYNTTESDGPEDPQACFPRSTLITQCPSEVALQISVTNLSPERGIYSTPLWAGFHDGSSFDTYDGGAVIPGFMVSFVEDGDGSDLSAAFASDPTTGFDLFVAGSGGEFNGPIEPGETATETVIVNPVDPKNRFFSYAAMILPSNDAFVANGNPAAHPIFDEFHNFLPLSIIIMGNAANDAGSEINDEIPENTAFFGQTVAGSGTDENGVVHDHPGFNSVGSGGILDDPRFNESFFTEEGYQYLQIVIEILP